MSRITRTLLPTISVVSLGFLGCDSDSPSADRDVQVGPCNAPACVGGSGSGGGGGAGGNGGGGAGGGAGGVDAGPDASVGLPDAFTLPDVGPRDADLPDASRPVMNPLTPRVDNATCVFPEIPPPGEMRATPAFGDLRFSRPLWLGAAPGDDERLYVMEQGGRIYNFYRAPESPTADLFLDLNVSRGGNEEGLLGMAFHPDYAENGRFFLYYSAANPRRSVISEWRRDPQMPWRADPASESVILEVGQPYSNHNGGDMHFGPDGYLYIGLGDGGSGGDPQNNGQRPTTLLGSVLRIDVDDPSPGCRYGIPPDNPFAPESGCVGGEAGRPEIWAWGLRNPWRMSFDRSTGALWVGDVGQGSYEEIDILEGGRNYGWNQVEGFACYRANCDPSAYAEPVYAYGRGDGRSITGGYVYRGPDFPELYGAYVYGDYETGRIWALRPGAEPENTLLVSSRQNISSFGEDQEGRLYFTAFNGQIWTLARPEGGGEVAQLPPRLSDTGCFSDLATLTPAPGVIPYDLNIPFWSDGAQKSRFLALPAGGSASLQADGTFEMPVGTVVIKHFDIDEVGRDALRRLETRFLVRQPTGWQGYTYRWDEAQQDAVLLEASRDEPIETARGAQVWHYPARTGCDSCHTEAGGHVLGFRAQQLHRGMTYGEVQYPQLQALQEAGLITGELAAVQALPRLNDEAVPLADRARALLDVNCAMCHQPDGPGNATIDLRLSTAFTDQRLCDVAPSQGDLDLAGARLIAPGAPDRSVLLRRMSLRGEDQMPPLGSNVVDTEGVRLVQRWIEGLDGCE